MYKILIISAHSQELSNIKTVIKNLDLPIKIDFAITWVGNYETVYSLTKILEHKQYDFVVNIWVCWFVWKKLKLIQVWAVYNLANKKELIIPICFEFEKIDKIITLDYQAQKLEDIEWFNYVDMESYWIELVLSKYNIPRIILKKPADEVWKHFNLSIIKEACEDLSRINYNKLLNDIIKYLETIPRKKSRDFIKSTYKFSFQEFEILKKKIDKYEILSETNFQYFFEKNKNIEKNKFLIILEKEIINLTK